MSDREAEQAAEDARRREAYRQEMQRIAAATAAGAEDLDRGDLARKLGSAVYTIACLNGFLEVATDLGLRLCDEALAAGASGVPQGMRRPMVRLFKTLGRANIASAALGELMQEVGIVLCPVEEVPDLPEGTQPVAVMSVYLGEAG